MKNCVKFIRVSAFLVVMSFGVGNALAQSGEMFQLFSGMMQAAQAQAGQKAWEQISPNERQCFQRGLSQEGASLDQVVRAGVLPNDPQLDPIGAHCEKFNGTELKRNYKCTVPDSGAFVTTICNQSFAQRQSDGTLTPITIDDAIGMEFSGSPATLMDVESGDARDARIRAATAQATAQQAAAARAEALRRLATFKDSAERETTPDISANLQADLLDLSAAYAKVLQPVAVPKPATPSASGMVVLPSLDCGPLLPYAKLICQNEQLRWLSLDFSRAFYAMLPLVPEQAAAMNAEAGDFNQGLAGQCRIDGKTLASPTLEARAAACLTAAIGHEREVFKLRLRQQGNAAALEEANRPIRDHLQLQGLLRDAGYLSSAEPIDGLYGSNTRSGLTRFQQVNGLPNDGFMDDATAAALRTARSFEQAAPQAVNDVQELEGRYQAYIAQVETAKSANVAAQLHASRIAKAQKALSAFPSNELKVFLTAYINPSAIDAAADLESRFSAMQTEIDAAAKLADEITSANQFIVTGADNDVLFLYNSSVSAPSVARNLQGTLIFPKDRTQACSLLDSSYDRYSVDLVRRKLKELGADVGFPLASCAAASLSGLDLIVAERKDIRALGPKLGELLQAVGDKSFTELGEVTESDVKQAKSDAASKAASLENAVIDGTASGSGILAIDDGSTVICEVVNDGIAPYSSALGKQSEQLAVAVGGEPTFVAKSADDAFIAAKRSQCGALYATAVDLKTIISGFKRDAVPYRFLPLWFSDQDIASSRDIATQREKMATERVADDARSLADQKALADAKSNDRDALRQKQEAQLRAQYGSMANAFELTLADEIKSFTDGKNPSFEEKYPGPAATYQNLLADHWELMSVDTALSDYGTAVFKGRTLEAGLAQSTIKLRNRILGEYKDLCLVTGYISDAEFQVERDPIGISCDGSSAAISSYEEGERFTSRWIVQ